jgi:hypothetical protein
MAKDRSSILSLAILGQENMPAPGMLSSMSSWHSSYLISQSAPRVVFAKGSY